MNPWKLFLRCDVGCPVSPQYTLPLGASSGLDFVSRLESKIVDMEVANWMDRLPNEVKDVPFFRLAIPGSHDSLSYTISASAPLAPDCPKVVRWMERVCGALTRAVLYKWSVTQSATLEEQLRNGVRYLDVRVAIREKGAPPLVVHHLCGAELGPLLAQLDTFLTAHPQEVVVVDFQHFYGFDRLDHERLVAHLQGLFGARLCPYWPGAPEEATLRWMQALSYQIVLVYRSEVGRGSSGVWPGETLPSPWPNVRSPRALLGFLQRGLAARDKRCGHVAQCVLTPRTTTVVPCGLFSSLRSGLARQCNRAVVPWLEKQHAGVGGVNVAIADFVGDDHCRFVDALVKLNLRTLKDAEVVKFGSILNEKDLPMKV